MTGGYVRIKRDGKYQSIEIEHLTDSEREEFFKDRDKEEILRWLNMLCLGVKNIEEEYFVRDS